MIITIELIGMFLCMFALLSKRYNTKSHGITLLLTVFNILFILLAWQSIATTSVVINIASMTMLAVTGFTMFKLKRPNKKEVNR